MTRLDTANMSWNLLENDQVNRAYMGRKISFSIL